MIKRYNNIKMSGEAILSAENSERNLWAVRAPPEPHWGAHSAPPDK